MKCGGEFIQADLASHYVNSCILSGYRKQWEAVVSKQTPAEIVTDIAAFASIKELYDSRYQQMVVSAAADLAQFPLQSLLTFIRSGVDPGRNLEMCKRLLLDICVREVIPEHPSILHNDLPSDTALKTLLNKRMKSK